MTACGGNDDDLSDEAERGIDDIEEGVDAISGEVAGAIEEAGEDVVELAVRNLASVHGEAEFADAGHPVIEGGLACMADATEDLTAVEVDCTGQTEAGGVASLSGTTTELPGQSLTELEGDFVGMVDDEEVFRTDALG
jgi:hypothetical protein